LRLIPNIIRKRIAYRKSLIKILDNISWLLFERVLRIVVSIFVIALLARYLGPEQFGQLNFSLALVAIFVPISELGMRSIVVRDITRNYSCRFETLGTTGVLYIISGLVSYGLILITISWLRPEDQLIKALVAILGVAVLFKPSEIATYWYESQVQSKYVVISKSGVLLVFAAINVVLIFNNAKLIVFAWTNVLEALVVSLLLLTILTQRLDGLKLLEIQFSLARAKSLIADSWPLIISSMSIIIYMKVDQIMIGYMLGDVEVGVYSAATRISEAWYFIAVAINASIYPTLVRLREQSIESFNKRLQQIFNLMVQISFIMAITITFFAPIIIQLLFGSDYVEAIEVLRIHIWAGVFVFLNNAVWAWYTIENKQKLANYRIIIGLFLNVALNIILIPLYGIIGAALATLISRAFVAYFGQLISHETRFLFIMMSHSILTVGIQRKFLLRKSS
jgi:O-antigen/teichoic acid export membrane protein